MEKTFSQTVFSQGHEQGIGMGIEIGIGMGIGMLQRLMRTVPIGSEDYAKLGTASRQELEAMCGRYGISTEAPGHNVP